MIKSHVFRCAALVATLGTMAACTTINNYIDSKKIDYKSSQAQTIKPQGLEIPPGLSSLPKDDRYSIPDTTGGTTLSKYNSAKADPGAAVASGAEVLPKVQSAYMERAGGQRWLVVNQSPDALWPIIREFWQDNGFLINVESPATGVMETDWAENRAKIPQDIIRNALTKYLDSVYDTGERDKFRTRLERRPDGGTEIYISHRGMEEVLTGPQKTSSMWITRPSDPELEAEFLRRLLVRIGVDESKAKTVVATNEATIAAGAPRAKLVAVPGSAPYLDVLDPFDRAWRRVGLALDRVSFTVEDRDRNQGIYYVRYVDAEKENKEKPGFFARIFKSTDDVNKQALQYRIQVLGQPDKTTTRVTVQNKDGVPETGDAANRILNLLNEQLK
jgi:outer membrane protein assembly factor BamC